MSEKEQIIKWIESSTEGHHLVLAQFLFWLANSGDEERVNQFIFDRSSDDFGRRIPEENEVFPHDIALEYARACGVENNSDDPIEIAEIELILNSLGMDWSDCESILECGTGPGMLSKWAIEAGAPKVIATDASLTMLDFCQKQHQDLIQSGRLELKEAEARELPFENNQFDLVMAKHLLHQLPSDAAFKFINEVVRILKPEGIAVIGDYNRASTREQRDARLAFTLPEMQPLLEETFDASFSPEELMLLTSFIPNIRAAVQVAEDPARISEKMKQIIKQDPVKGHAVDWQTRLRLVIQKLPSKGGNNESSTN